MSPRVHATAMDQTEVWNYIYTGYGRGRAREINDQLPFWSDFCEAFDSLMKAAHWRARVDSPSCWYYVSTAGDLPQAGFCDCLQWFPRTTWSTCPVHTPLWALDLDHELTNPINGRKTYGIKLHKCPHYADNREDDPEVVDHENFDCFHAQKATVIFLEWFMEFRALTPCTGFRYGPLDQVPVPVTRQIVDALGEKAPLYDPDWEFSITKRIFTWELMAVFHLARELWDQSFALDPKYGRPFPFPERVHGIVAAWLHGNEIDFIHDFMDRLIKAKRDRLAKEWLDAGFRIVKNGS